MRVSDGGPERFMMFYDRVVNHMSAQLLYEQNAQKKKRKKKKRELYKRENMWFMYIAYTAYSMSHSIGHVLMCNVEQILFKTP